MRGYQNVQSAKSKEMPKRTMNNVESPQQHRDCLQGATAKTAHSARSKPTVCVWTCRHKYTCMVWLADRRCTRASGRLTLLHYTFIMIGPSRAS